MLAAPGDVLGFSAAEWTALGTIALAVVTLLYVLITRKLARSALESAKSAAIAAKATQEATAISRAALDFSFVPRFLPADEKFPARIEVFWQGSVRVYFRGAKVWGIYQPTEPEDLDDLAGRRIDRDLAWVHPSISRHHLQLNDILAFRWPGEPTEKPSLRVTVAYSLAKDSDVETLDEWIRTTD